MADIQTADADVTQETPDVNVDEMMTLSMGPNHPSTLTSLSNLTLLYTAQGATGRPSRCLQPPCNRAKRSSEPTTSRP